MEILNDFAQCYVIAIYSQQMHEMISVYAYMCTIIVFQNKKLCV